MRNMLAILFLRLGLGFGLVLGLQTAAIADDAPQPTIEQILSQQQTLRAALQAGDPQYNYLDSMRRREIFTEQRRVMGLLLERKSMDELNADQKIVVFNSLQKIAGLLERREGDEMVCERTRVAGTNRYELVCMTKDAQRKYRERSQEALSRAQKCDECAGG